MTHVVELERTFLLKNLPPGIEKCRKMEIDDLYIPASSEHPVIRIRRMDEWMEITKKHPAKGNDSSKQLEHTIELSREEHAAMSKLRGKRLTKTRYFYGKAEIDVFRGPLRGLVTADFEFRSGRAMRSFTPPDFCLAEVTQEKIFAGGMLCGKSYSDIEPVLKKHGYRKILF